MRKAQILIVAAVALTAAACSRHQQTYVLDPATGQPVPVVAQQSNDAAPAGEQAYAQAPASSGDRGLFNSRSFMSRTNSQAAAATATEDNRGFFNTQPSAPVYAQAQLEQPTVMQYRRPQAPAPRYAQSQQYTQPQDASPQHAAPRYAAAQGAYASAAYDYASASPYAQPYTLDAGDKLRIMVFGQDGISNTYIVDAAGNINMPLIGSVPARGFSTRQLSQMIAERLKQGYVREPHVTVEVETYRPFFILGEVTNPGQYSYVADMTVEKAIAIAGGFSPRASKRTVELTRNVPGQQFKGSVPLNYPLRPGDTVVVKERWF